MKETKAGPLSSKIRRGICLTQAIPANPLRDHDVNKVDRAKSVVCERGRQSVRFDENSSKAESQQADSQQAKVKKSS